MAEAQFADWTEAEILGAIKELETAMTLGLQSASYPGGGYMQYTPYSNMQATLGALYKARDRVQGVAPKTRIRRVIHTSRKGL